MNNDYISLFCKKNILFLFFSMQIIAAHDPLSRGIQLLQQQKLDAAYECFLEVLKTNNHDPEQTRIIGNNLLLLGNTFYSQFQLEKSAMVFEQLASLFPTSASVHFNLGFTLNELTHYHQAQESFKKACVLKPDAIEFQVALATALLATGDYKHGWPLYEKRWELPDKKAIIMHAPRWNGQSLEKKTILLLSEGALGDCIQFVRYAQVLKNMDATIILKTLKPLQTLLSNCPYIDQIITDNTTPPCDYYSSLMSLPALLHTTLHTIPINIPYIFPDNTLKKRWREILTKDSFNIGICWHADATNDANRPPLAKRSMAPELFAPLATISGITLFSLQHGQVAPSFMHDFGTDLDTIHGRFMDTSAIISNLDLVISVDTSIAHLSAALGCPTWVILPYKADWRWLDKGDDCPWYPGMKLFRKKLHENWDSVIERTHNILFNMLNDGIENVQK